MASTVRISARARAISLWSRQTSGVARIVTRTRAASRAVPFATASTIYSFQMFLVTRTSIVVADPWPAAMSRQVRFVNLTPEVEIRLSPDQARPYAGSLPLVDTPGGQIEQHGGGWWACTAPSQGTVGQILVVIEKPSP